MPESKEEKIRRLNQELEDFIAAEVAKSQEKKGDEKSFEEILQVYCCCSRHIIWQFYYKSS